MRLSQNDISRYDQLGFLFPISALSGDETLQYVHAFEELEQHYHQTLRSEDLKYLHLCFPWACELATHPAILDVVESLLGPNILIHSSSVFYKNPTGRQFVSWHQDGYYLGLSEPRLVSAWIALTASTVENGCLKVIPASHARLVAHEDRPRAGNLLGSGLTIASSVDETSAIDIELAPGQFSLHHVNLVHGSECTRNGERRIGFAVRYVSTEVSQELVHPPVILARGKNDFCHFEVVGAPSRVSLAESAVHQAEIHREYLRRRSTQTSGAAREA